MISLDKSHIFFSRNTSSDSILSANNILNFTTSTDLGRYLGEQVIHGRAGIKLYGNVLEKVKDRIHR